MTQYEEGIKSISLIIFSVASFAGLVKWGIEKYFKKNEEVLELKEKMNNKSISIIEKSMTKVGNDLNELSKNMSDLERQLIFFHERMDHYESNTEHILETLEKLSKEKN